MEYFIETEKKGWLSDFSCKCCKNFVFLETGQSALFLTSILQIEHKSHALNIEAINQETNSVMVWITFLEEHFKEATETIDCVEELYRECKEII
jgi:hypothetical protein